LSGLGTIEQCVLLALMRIVKSILLFSAIGLTFFACTLIRTGSSAEQKVFSDDFPSYSIVFVPMTSVTVGNARAYQDGEHFVVAGRVKRLHEVHLPGHLDLAICGSDGTLLVQKTTRIFGLSSKRHGSLELPFRIHLDVAPPEGATILLRYHAPASGDPDQNCIQSD